MNGYQVPLLEGVRPAHVKGDELERDYTPRSLALAGCRAMELTSPKPKRILEAHAGGGAWVEAAREVWPKATIGVGDADPHARGLTLGDEVVYQGRFEDHLEEWSEWGGEDGPEWVLGNPPFSLAAYQLADIAQLCPWANVAWLLPFDIYTTAAWREHLVEHPPRFIRPITSRVWTFVRGLALFEWWNVGKGTQWAPQVIPLDWSK